MSKALVGMLRAVLSLETGAFEKGANAAEKRTAALRKSMLRTGKAFRNVGAGMTAAITAPLAGVAAAATRAADNMIALDQQARIAGVGMQRFKVMALSAKVLGIEQDKLADILKDVNDKIGDFMETGAGPMADFFENIAPKVGITKEAFKGLSSDEALGLYVSSLEKAGVSQQEMTFYMEALASDATALIPMFRDNGAAIEEMAKAASDLGMELDGNTIQAAQKSRQEFQLVAEILRTKLQASLATLLPAFTGLAQAAVPILTVITDKVKAAAEWFSQLSPRARGFTVAAVGLAAALGPVIAGIGLMIMGLAPLAGLIGAVISPIGLLAVAAVGAGVAIAANWDTISAKLPALTGVLESAFSLGKFYATDMAQNSITAFSNLLTSIESAVVAVQALFSGDWSLSWENAKTAVSDFVTFGLNLNPLSPLADKVSEKGAEVGQAIRDMVADAKTNLKNGFQEGVDKAVAVVSELGPEIKATISQIASDVWDAAFGVGENIVEGIKGGIAKVRESLRIDVTALGDLIPQWIRDKLGIKSPSREMATIGGQIAEGLAVGIDGGQSSVRRAIDSLTDGLDESGGRAEKLEDGLEDAADAAIRLGNAGAAGARKMSTELSAAEKMAKSVGGELRGVGQGFFSDLVSNPSASLSNLWTGFKDIAGKALGNAIFHSEGLFAGFAPAMQNISTGLATFAAGGSGALAGLGTALGGAMPYIGAAIAVFNLIKNFSKTEKIGAGLKLGIKDGEVFGGKFDRMRKTTFWGLMKREYDQSKPFSDHAVEAFQKQATAVRTGITRSMRELGVRVSTDFVEGVDLAVKRINTKNMSKEEIQEAVDRIFTQYANQIGLAVAKIGSRAAQVLSGVQGTLEPLGKKLDLFARGIRDAGKVNLLPFAKAANHLATLAGGLDALGQKTQAFFDGFYSDSEKLDYMRDLISRTFRRLGLDVPKTDDAFKELVLSQNLMTKAGRRAYAALLEIAPIFDQVTDAVVGSAAQIRGAYQLDGAGFATSWQAKLATEMQNAGRYSSDMITAQNAELARQTKVLERVEVLLRRQANSADDALTFSQIT